MAERNYAERQAGNRPQKCYSPTQEAHDLLEKLRLKWGMKSRSEAITQMALFHAVEEGILKLKKVEE